MPARRTTTPGNRDPRYVELRECLKQRRKELGLSQQALADRLGLHKQFVSRVEMGSRRLDIIEFSDFVRALDMEPADLVRAIPIAEGG